MIKYFLVLLFIFIRILVLASILDLTVTPQNLSMDNIDTTTYTGGTRFHFCDLTILSTSTNGFYLTINSANGSIVNDQSVFLRENRTTSELYYGEYQPFSFWLDLPVVNSPGDIYTPTSYTQNSQLIFASPYQISVNAENFYINYSQAPNNVTTNATISVYIESVKKDKLLRGIYEDIISFTLTEN